VLTEQGVPAHSRASALSFAVAVHACCRPVKNRRTALQMRACSEQCAARSCNLRHTSAVSISSATLSAHLPRPRPALSYNPQATSPCTTPSGHTKQGAPAAGGGGGDGDGGGSSGPDGTPLRDSSDRPKATTLDAPLQALGPQLGGAAPVRAKVRAWGARVNGCWGRRVRAGSRWPPDTGAVTSSCSSIAGRELREPPRGRASCPLPPPPMQGDENTAADTLLSLWRRP
jgi:hypothetical protein